jgi:hypothetical protein
MDNVAPSPYPAFFWDLFDVPPAPWTVPDGTPVHVPTTYMQHSSQCSTMATAPDGLTTPSRVSSSRLNTTVASRRGEQFVVLGALS